MSKKKRASESESGIARKKHKKDNGLAKVLSVDFAGKEDWDPIVATTSGFHLNTETQLDAYQSRDEIYVQSRDPNNVVYHGREDASLVHYIAIYDEAGASLELVPARHIPLSSTILDEEVVKDDEKTMREKRSQLGMAFGTKKAKKNLQAELDNAVAPESSRGNTEFNKTLLASIKEGTATMKTPAELKQNMDASKPRPKHNPAATSIQEVYSLENILGNELIVAVPLDSWKSCIGKPVELPTKSVFAKRRLAGLKLPEDLERLRILRLIGLMVDFYQSLLRKGRDLRALPPRETLKANLQVPDFAIDELLKRFTNHKKPLNRWDLDKIALHIAALALLADNCSVDFYNLKDDLNLETKEMTKYYQELGCRVTGLRDEDIRFANISKTEAKLHRRAQLTLPPVFPEIRRGKAKR